MKVILKLPQPQKTFIIIQSSQCFMSIAPLKTSFSSFSLWLLTNTVSEVLKEHGQTDHFLLLLLQPVIALHHQGAQNYRSRCNQSETRFIIVFYQRCDFSNHFPLQVWSKRLEEMSSFPELQCSLLHLLLSKPKLWSLLKPSPGFHIFCFSSCTCPRPVKYIHL